MSFKPLDIVQLQCLGRPFRLGMLYDCRTDQPIVGMTLWNSELLSKTEVQTRNISNFRIHAYNKSQHKNDPLEIKGEIKLNIMCGLIKSLSGWAAHFYDKVSSSTQARIILSYHQETFFEQLTMNQLDFKSIEYPEILDKDIATHVVTGIEWGVNVAFIFNKQTTSEQNKTALEAQLAVDLLNSVQFKGKKDSNTNSSSTELNCTFYGDLILEKMPSSFEEAINICENLPNKIREMSSSTTRTYGVALVAHLIPISLFRNQNTQTYFYRKIDDRILLNIENLFDVFDIVEIKCCDLKTQYNDLLNILTDIQKQLSMFRFAMKQFLSSVTENYKICYLKYEEERHK